MTPRISKWALLNLRRNPTRSIIAVLAVSLAAACISLSVGVLAGLNQRFREFVEETGVFDVITITANSLSPEFRRAGPPTIETSGALGRAIPAAHVGGELVWWNFAIETGQRSARLILAGASSALLPALRHTVAEGRTISDIDNRNRARVIVLGQKARAALFPGEENVVGRHVRLRGVDFLVVGVLRRYAYYDGNNADEMPYKNGYNFIPLETAQELYGHWDRHVSYIQVRPRDAAEARAIEAAIRSQLFLRHQSTRAFNISNSAAQAGEWTRTQLAMRIGLSLLSGACLVIGAACTLNAQLASVAERLREFGIRRAIGASRSSILGLVLQESVLLATAGGILGTLASFGLLPVVKSLLPTGSPGAPVFVWWSVPASIFTSGATGLLAGIWPAWKASKLNPVEAIRVV